MTLRDARRPTPSRRCSSTRCKKAVEHFKRTKPARFRVLVVDVQRSAQIQLDDGRPGERAAGGAVTPRSGRQRNRHRGKRRRRPVRQGVARPWCNWSVWAPSLSHNSPHLLPRFLDELVYNLIKATNGGATAIFHEHVVHFYLSEQARCAAPAGRAVAVPSTLPATSTRTPRSGSRRTRA
ncbi:hypothetical protein AMAG_02844 [Allomyces macrogynus ATCC 38327]|uniref:Uncharacterized protein n=1 Tax=Allomyces macrogynus (strain ATCC 38327) TaxID=578462 RepID=A0A0L0S3Z9_ALLM3|nr:hypothetical protein AMAG_02844 [Allomyces macrogynus ATCC 38327]|eukprot:KNE57094.1 hypothetical protein AMAG_02844 [Allomyces macrogynus ATCC 38327]